MTARKASPTILSLIAAAGAGAAMMYFLDPSSGARRRARVRDGTSRVYRGGRESARKKAVDLRNRAQGWNARLSRTFGGAMPVSDDVLANRIRSQLGHLATHAGAIDVRVASGCVKLGGRVLLGEASRIVAAITSMDGVRSVDQNWAIAEEWAVAPTGGVGGSGF
jgi:hypothetical protein